ncbi:MAG: AraC family transcriptional regulator [Treponema sp.]|nr:AraC family transcriptional regulator [Treponema sp.]
MDILRKTVKSAFGMKWELKHKYLVRLIITALIFLYIPILVCFGVIFPWVYNEVFATRENHYQELIQYFCADFEQQVSVYYTAAMQLSVNSRNSRNSAYVLSSSIFSQSPYYYLECIRALSEMDLAPGISPMIYFPDSDCLFTRSYKCTAESYIKNYLVVQDPTEIRKLFDFLGKPGETGNSEGSIKYYSTFAEYGAKGKLFLGIPVKMGMKKEEALVFFIMDKASLNVTGLYAGREDIQFMIFDTPPSRMLYSAGNFILDGAVSQSLAESSDKIIRAGEDQYRLFRYRGTFGNTFLSVIPIDRIITEIYDFTATMIKIGLTAGILIFLLLGFMVYINYKPIGHLADEISERNRLILDLLLGNLLYGLPIPPREAEKLGFKNNDANFFVITVFNHKFRITDRDVISSELYSRFTATCYITDILYQEYEVIICLLPNNDTKPIREYLETKIPLPGTFIMGPIVESLDKIKDSFRACLEQNFEKEPVRRVKSSNEKQNQPFMSIQKAQIFRNNVINYVEEQFSNPQLSQISVADHFGISIYSLSRLFNKDIGIGFAEFITAKRMEAARTLLLTSDKDIAEIAKIVGLVNTNYFSRLFKTYFGVIPSRYRLKKN